jgi:hypothetical protein
VIKSGQKGLLSLSRKRQLLAGFVKVTQKELQEASLTEAQRSGLMQMIDTAREIDEDLLRSDRLLREQAMDYMATVLDRARQGFCDAGVSRRTGRPRNQPAATAA